MARCRINRRRKLTFRGRAAKRRPPASARHRTQATVQSSTRSLGTHSSSSSHWTVVTIVTVDMATAGSLRRPSCVCLLCVFIQFSLSALPSQVARPHAMSYRVKFIEVHTVVARNIWMRAQKQIVRRQADMGDEDYNQAEDSDLRGWASWATRANMGAQWRNRYVFHKVGWGSYVKKLENPLINKTAAGRSIQTFIQWQTKVLFSSLWSAQTSGV